MARAGATAATGPPPPKLLSKWDAALLMAGLDGKGELQALPPPRPTVRCEAIVYAETGRRGTSAAPLSASSVQPSAASALGRAPLLGRRMRLRLRAAKLPGRLKMQLGRWGWGGTPPPPSAVLAGLPSSATSPRFMPLLLEKEE